MPGVPVQRRQPLGVKLLLQSLLRYWTTRIQAMHGTDKLHLRSHGSTPLPVPCIRDKGRAATEHPAPVASFPHTAIKSTEVTYNAQTDRCKHSLSLCVRHGTGNSAPVHCSIWKVRPLHAVWNVSCLSLKLIGMTSHACGCRRTVHVQFEKLPRLCCTERCTKTSCIRCRSREGA